MQSFDDDYMARREKQIRDRFILQAVARTSTLIAILCTISLLAPQATILQMGFIGLALIMWILAAFTWTISRAETEAEKAIQAEQERLLKLYELAGEKPKRDTMVRLSEDGELVTETDHHSHQSGG